MCEERVWQGDFGVVVGVVIVDCLWLLLCFDVEWLCVDLVMVGGDWIDYLVKGNYDGLWIVLLLCYVVGVMYWVMMIYVDFVGIDFVDGLLFEWVLYLCVVFVVFCCLFQVVWLMWLVLGVWIKLYCDYDLVVEWGMVCVYVLIIINFDVVFLLNGMVVMMVFGEVWYLWLVDIYVVVNYGVIDCVYLVFDCIVDDWLLVMLREGGVMLWDWRLGIVEV